MTKRAHYYCRPVTLRGEKTIDVQSAIAGCYSYQLTYVGAEFVKNVGNNAIAFIKETGNAKLLLLCNKKTGEIFIPDSYSEVERVVIRQQFIRYLFSAYSRMRINDVAEEFPEVLFYE